MIFVGEGALLQQAVSTAAQRGHRIDGVFGNTERVAAFCRQHGLPFERSQTLDAEPERLRTLCPDGLGFSIDNGQILSARVLDAAGITFYGIHGGIIPSQRGNPVVAAIFAILHGSAEYGATLFALDAGIDSGEVLATSRFPLGPRVRLHEVVVETALRCHSLFEQHLDSIVQGTCRRERVSMAGTTPYRRKDLQKLCKYRDHADFDRATDLGILDGLLCREDREHLAALRGRAEPPALRLPEAEYPWGERVHELIEAQVRKTPQALAVVGPHGERLCYEQVNRRANQLARRLVGHERVALFLDRGVGLVIGPLGVLKAGAAFVPLDPAYPQERLSFMLQDAGISLLVTQRSLQGKLPAGSWQVLWLDELEELADEDLRLPVGPHDLAYVIYTSGSTGRPKGVMIEHASLHNTLAATQQVFPMGPSDRFLSLASFGSDTVIGQLLGPLCWGGSAVVGAHVADPADILREIEAHAVSVVELVPSLLRVFLEELGRGLHSAGSLRALISSGEALPSSLLEQAVSALPDCAVYNSYGPTETASQVTFHRCLPGEPVTIGAPLPRTRIYVLDPQGQPLPVGVTGEIVLGGAGVARGYLGRPELTAQRFAADPWQPGARMYRTGDLGRELAGGLFEFLGRCDQQVKIRGHRVELGEIEDALRRLPGIRDAVVLLEQDARLVAYLLVGDEPLSAERLREPLRRWLPAHMMPASFVPVRQWPLSPHGKVDRAALTGRPLEREPPLAPRSELEGALARLWSEVLGSPVGIHDDFFESGGHSLLALRLLASVRAASGVTISLGALSDMPTVARMAAFLASGQPRCVGPERELLLRDAELPASISGTGRACEPGDVLLTGATGFLGRHLLRALLERTPARVWCLVRSPSRLPVHERVVPVAGDLARPGLGLDPRLREALAEQVSAIYHLGAQVNHVASYAALQAANVGGTLELLRLASEGRSKVVHFVSSADVVSGDASEHMRYPEPPSGVDAYTCSKWVADQLVAQAQARGVPACIYRTGYVGPHQHTGDANATGWFELYLKTALELGCLPQDGLMLSLTPVDLVIEAIVSLSLRPDSLGRAFHLLHRERAISSEIIARAAQLEQIPRERWRERLARLCAEHPSHPAVVLGPYLDARVPHTPSPSPSSWQAALAMEGQPAFDPGALVRAFLALP